uniref:Molybdopterin synthase n=1 Tax=Parastrongyloides trichosuri TaxID=131310 RepID=A0A0N4ZN30_PARTI
MVFILGIVGCTCSGKTTLGNIFYKKASYNKIIVDKISQDDFYIDEGSVRRIESKDNPNVIFYDYDSIASLNQEKLIEEVHKRSKSCDLLIIEGTMLLEIKNLVSYFSKILYITLDKETCRDRRKNRKDYDPPDMEGYFDQIVWPAYEMNLNISKNNIPKDIPIDFIKGENIDLNNIEDFCKIFWRCLKLDVLRIVKDKEINISDVSQMVSNPSCGAISMFVGVTRDNFNGKHVKRLEYECYEEMAMKELKKLCIRGRNKYKNIQNIAILHRINHVPVTEASVVIAVSSPHRLECQELSSFLINELKKTVPIWKKEIYSDNSGDWKENCCKE